MRILCTGSAGFICSHLVDALLAQGHEVIGFDDLSTGKSENTLQHRTNPAYIEMCGDVREPPTGLMRGVDVVYHLAAAKKVASLNNPDRDFTVNAGGALAMLQAAVGCKVRKFVHVSTGSVYGEAKYVPQDEAHPLNPVSLYGVSKLAGERYAAAFGAMYGLDVTILRYFHVYGPRQDSSCYGGVIPIFIRHMLAGEPLTVYGDGTQERSFTYIDDVTAVNLMAMAPEMRGQVFNVASGIKVTINRLIEELACIFGYMPEVHYEDWQPGDVRKFDVSNVRLAMWSKSSWIPFEDGLRRTVAWYRARV